MDDGRLGRLTVVGAVTVTGVGAENVTVAFARRVNCKACSWLFGTQPWGRAVRVVWSVPLAGPGGTATPTFGGGVGLGGGGGLRVCGGGGGSVGARGQW